MTADAPAGPDTRYGRPSRRPAHAMTIAGAVFGIIVATAITLVAYQWLGRAEVSGKMVAYQVVDADTVSVTISVTRSDPSVPVSCIVRARSRDGSETGRREVLVPAAAENTVTLTTTVKSNAPYVGDIYGCGTDIPGYLLRTP